MAKKKNGILSSLFRRGKSKEPASAELDTENSQSKAPQPVTADNKMVENSLSEINSIIPSTPISYRSTIVSEEQIDQPTKEEPALIESSTSNQSGKTKTTDSKTQNAKKKKPKVAPPPPLIDQPYEERAVDVNGEKSSRKPTEIKQSQHAPEVISKQREMKAEPLKIVSDNTKFEADLNPVQDVVNDEEVARDRSTTSCSNSSNISASAMIQAGVIHYSPHGTIRSSSALSPEPISDVPHIERQSNFQLSDDYKLKSISVTRYDGRPKQRAPLPPSVFENDSVVSTSKKRAAPTPPTVSVHATSSAAPVSPVTAGQALSSPVVPQPKQPAKPSRKAADISSVVSEPVKPRLSDNVNKQQKQTMGPKESPKAISRSKEEIILENKYEALAAKFSRWKALKSISGETEEVKKLQVELYRDHDEVMSLVRESGLYTNDTMSLKTIDRKKRPSLAPDLFQPRVPAPIRTPLTIVAGQQSINMVKPLSPSPFSSPGTSRPVTPKSSSISPAASEDSADSGVVKGNSPKLSNRSPISKTSTLDINSNVIRTTKPQRKSSDEKQKAIDRIAEDARDLMRKEQELKRISMSSLPSPSPVSPKSETGSYKEAQGKSSPKPRLSPSSPRVPPNSTVITTSTSKKENITKATYHVHRSPMNMKSPTITSKATSPIPPPVPSTPIPHMTRWSSQVVVNSVSVEDRVRHPPNKMSSPKLPHVTQKLPTPRLPDNASVVNRPSAFTLKDSPTITGLRYFDSPTPSYATPNSTSVAAKTPVKDTSPVVTTVNTVDKRVSMERKPETKKSDIIRTDATGTTIEIGRSVVAKSSPTISKTLTTAKSSPHYNTSGNSNLINSNEKNNNKFVRKNLNAPAANTEEPVSTVILKSAVITSNEAQVTNSPLNSPIRKPKKLIPAEKAKTLPSRKSYDTPISPKPTTLEAEITNNFPVLRSVGAPKERSGIALGRVLDTSPSTSKSAPNTPVSSIPAAPPPPPSLTTTPTTVVPPPPPPPPSNLLSSPSTSNTKRLPSISNNNNVPPSPPVAPPLINSRDLINQKAILKKTSPVEKQAPMPSDLVGSLMAEIRKAGGLSSLKKVSA